MTLADLFRSVINLRKEQPSIVLMAIYELLERSQPKFVCSLGPSEERFLRREHFVLEERSRQDIQDGKGEFLVSLPTEEA